MRTARIGLVALVLALASSAAARRVETVAGPTPSTVFNLGLDAAGNLYSFDRYGSRVDRIAPNGNVTMLLDSAGDGFGHVFDCPGIPGYICYMTVTAAGDVYVTGGESKNVFHVDPSGVVTQLIDATGDGAGHVLAIPSSIAVDISGNLFVASGNGNVFKITPVGVISYVTSVTGFVWPVADAFGNVFIGAQNIVLRYDALGGLTTMLDATGDGLGHSFDTLVFSAIPAVDAAGNIYVTGEGSNNAFKVAPDGAVTLLIDAAGDGLGHTVDRPLPAVVDSQGVVYVVSGYVSPVRTVFRIDPGGAVSLRAVGEANDWPLVDADDQLYLSGDHGVRRLTSAGMRILLDQRADGTALGLNFYFGYGAIVTPGVVYAVSTESRVLRAEELCDPAPRSGCRHPTVARASTLLVKNGTDDGRDSVTWKWTKGEATDVSAFGDPATLDYTLCLYGGDGRLLFEASAPAGTPCGTAACWSAETTVGFDYLSPAQAPDGMRKVLLRAGATGKAKISLKARGANLPDDLSLPVTFPLLGQLQASNGACWEAAYAEVDATRNFPNKLVARGQ